MKAPGKSFHSSCEDLRNNLHVVLVRPEYGGNIGAAARALENMGILGSFRLVTAAEKLNVSEVRKMAKHAHFRVSESLLFSSLKEALSFPPESQTLILGASARVGSSHRPHPQLVRPAIRSAVDKLRQKEITDLILVFGPESDGLSNEEIDLCDWLVTIPSHPRYRSLNLAQSVMVFSHEVNENLMDPVLSIDTGRPNQKGKIIQHLIQLAEQSGFILPGDPLKMKPRLEEIFNRLPPYLPEASTLHGLMDQVSRSMKKGEPDFKGRYKHFVTCQGEENGVQQ